ncbi:polysaccharide deacetylase family protein [Candidatus Peregrinibacteria bacterium]|jgi:peptidoglycan/xylan/chitin deacetylase (PgdA/CDA1 family)|nr:polysaccharide deacetylase family protein [Candidatus Peregrinibacteria bacterium]MBT4147890.1 polysaccharide deacetylase family protein [Candidatus Peregrinibacteria bacterium]MBT4365907.1 polysaccharide deacetylase family protein [Candidatus Peregrinibacteria bacterium]MBT4456381.1 polysaccharide deacetylase family protein [Candidatus Peregrinibacteria bacterium]
MNPLEKSKSHDKSPDKAPKKPRKHIRKAGQLDRNEMSELFKMAQLGNQPEWFPEHLHITIDDGPYPHHLKKILQVLDRHNVKATFFLIGSMIESQYRKDPKGTRKLLLKLLNKGHEIGYHSYNHCHNQRVKNCGGKTFESLSAKDIEYDIEKFKETLEKVLEICYIVKIGRTPGGKGRTRRAVSDAFRNQNLEVHKHWHDEPARRERPRDPKKYHELKKDHILLFHQKKETAKELNDLLHKIRRNEPPPTTPSPNPPSSQ